MSIKFDPKTGNLLEPITSGRKLKFISITGEIYDAQPDDTLLYNEDINDSSFIQYNHFFKNITKDPTNPKEIKYCPECKKDSLIVMIRVRNDLFNKCWYCSKQWMEGVE